MSAQTIRYREPRSYGSWRYAVLALVMAIALAIALAVANAGGADQTHHGRDRRLGPDDRTPGAANHNDRGSRWPGGRTPAALTDAESDDARPNGAGVPVSAYPAATPSTERVKLA